MNLSRLTIQKYIQHLINNIMRATELRIGNWVMEQDRRLVLIHYGFGIDHAQQFKAIPLTEKWLTKLGFKWNELARQFEHDNTSKFTLLHKGSNYYNAESLDIILANLSYVHELQNLFFALTGEELEIK